MSVFRGDELHPNSSDIGRDLRVLDGIASWCGAVHDAMPLAEALAAIGQALDSFASAITRDHRGEDRPRLVAYYDASAGDGALPTLKSGYANDVLGAYYNRMRIGTVWFLSDNRESETSERLIGWLRSRNVEDIVVVALETAGVRNDYIEFHFNRSLSESEKRDIETVMPTLVRAWAGRKTGLVTRTQMDERMIRARAAASKARPGLDEAILGMSNPARLSRAEFRVCLLLSRGLSVKAVTEELGLSESTIRSHLCSIYAKTETTGLAELLYRILSPSSSELGRHYARVV